MLLVQFNSEQRMDKMRESDRLIKDKVDQLTASKTDQNSNLPDADLYNSYGALESDESDVFDSEDISENDVLNITDMLLQKLKRTREADLNLEVFLPKDLLYRIAKDIVSLSYSEPYGLKGCVVHVNLQRNSMVHKLGQIQCDMDTVSTFELFLTIVEDKKCWHNLGDLMVTFLSRCLSDNVVYLSTNYRLEKQKLYRSNSLSSSGS